MQKDLRITFEDAQKFYPNSNNGFKDLLEQTFGKEELTNKVDLSKIKTYADICKLDKVHPIKSLPFPKPKNDEQRFLNATARCARIVRVIVNGWKPDFSNSSQPKWYIWWKYNTASSAFVFGDALDYYDSTLTNSGSRFCFETREQCEHVGKHFVKEFNEMLLNK
jgi:hypothetical protein